MQLILNIFNVASSDLIAGGNDLLSSVIDNIPVIGAFASAILISMFSIWRQHKYNLKYVRESSMQKKIWLSVEQMYAELYVLKMSIRDQDDSIYDRINVLRNEAHKCIYLNKEILDCIDDALDGITECYSSEAIDNEKADKALSGLKRSFTK